MDQRNRTFRRYEDDEPTDNWELSERIFEQDRSYKCPTYVHRTPPCQGSCPAGEDIRGWLNIVRGMEKPGDDLKDKDFGWAEYAFRRSADANPFPAIMGRVCPAPCEDALQSSMKLKTMWASIRLNISSAISRLQII